jgi:4,5-dihydroxyphthalate decarboxylase
MSVVTLSAALTNGPFTQPLIAGRVVPQGIELVPTVLHPSEMFWRQLHHEEFDVSELSVASLAIAVASGNRSWVALPVFTSRELFHLRLRVRADSTITGPAELAGKRVGLPEYQQTAAVWARGVLEHDFGVSPRDVHWFLERPESRSHAVAGPARPPGVTITPVADGRSVLDLLLAGELDAIMWSAPTRNLIDPAHGPAGDRIRPLFDAATERARFRAEHGLLPANHCVVVRRALVEKHPWLPLNLYTAFEDAKRAVLGSFRSVLDAAALATEVSAELAATDPVPYGLRAEQRMLDTLFGHLREQGLVPADMRAGDVFHGSAATF